MQHELIFFKPPQVRYLKIIEKSGYQALPWVRYITQNGGMPKNAVTLLTFGETNQLQIFQLFKITCDKISAELE